MSKFWSDAFIIQKQSIFPKQKPVMPSYFRNSIKKIQYSYGIPFIVLSCLYLAYVISNINEGFYHDSQKYWLFGQTFIDTNGHFSLLNYNLDNNKIQLRGYLFPLITLLIDQIANLIGIKFILLFRFFAAFSLAAFVSYLLPAVFLKIHKKKPTITSIFLVGVTIFYFWRGFLLYPLSDFPAVASILLSFLLYPTNRLQTTPIVTTVQSFLAGIFLASTIIIRPAYQITLILGIGYLLLESIRGRKSFIACHWKRLLMLVFGMAVILFPQYQINSTNFNKHTPLVAGQGLFFQQLLWGMEMQRYETFKGDTKEYPIAQVRFQDIRGKQIIAKEIQSLKKENKYLWYLKLLSKYPVYFSSMYLTHFANGLDITYPTVYIKNLTKRSFLFSLANYSLWNFLIIFLIETNFFITHKNKIYPLCLFISPSLLAVPGAVETRFFLPMFIVLYVFVFFCISTDYIIANIRSLIKRYSLFYIVIVTLWFRLSLFVFSTIEHGQISINTL